MWEYQTGVFPGFTKKYSVKTLVWLEAHETRESAFVRERQIKKREWKWRLQVIADRKSRLEKIWSRKDGFGQHARTLAAPPFLI